MIRDWKLMAWDDFNWMLEVNVFYSDNVTLRTAMLEEQVVLRMEDR
jgi:hypothetical protein